MDNPENIVPIWNSVEIIKIIISALTPILVAFLLFYFNRVIKRSEKKQWTNQKIIEKRIQLYDYVTPKLNDLFCFYCFIGNWKDLTPKDIIKLKRDLYKKIYIYAPLFSQQFLNKYNTFSNQCFSTFNNWGEDAKIKSPLTRRKEVGEDNWKLEWDELFDDNYTNDLEISNDIALIKEKYKDFIDEFINNLEICKPGIFHDSDVPSINF